MTRLFNKAALRRYNHHCIEEIVTLVGVRSGIPSSDAQLLAHALIDADLHGIYTHGVTRVGVYMRRIQAGLIDPLAVLDFEHGSSLTLKINANNGIGHVQASKSLDRLIPTARQNGMAAAVIRNSQHCGAMSYYTNRAADENMILFAVTNCEPSMAPYGGADAFFGTNPIAVSFPTGKGFHIKIDLSTSVTARGNIVAAAKKGGEIPPGWALDQNGYPTTDSQKALLGTVLTMAGHKGYALALMVEVLAGVLSGAAIGPQVGSMYKDPPVVQNVGHFFFLMNIEAFMDMKEFVQRIDTMIDAIKSSRLTGNSTEILVPGERSHRIAQENRKNGIPIDDATVAELQALCEKFGIAHRL